MATTNETKTSSSVRLSVPLSGPSAGISIGLSALRSPPPINPQPFEDAARKAQAAVQALPKLPKEKLLDAPPKLDMTRLNRQNTIGSLFAGLVSGFFLGKPGIAAAAALNDAQDALQKRESERYNAAMKTYAAATKQRALNANILNGLYKDAMEKSVTDQAQAKDAWANYFKAAGIDEASMLGQDRSLQAQMRLAAESQEAAARLTVAQSALQERIQHDHAMEHALSRGPQNLTPSQIYGQQFMTAVDLAQGKNVGYAIRFMTPAQYDVYAAEGHRIGWKPGDPLTGPAGVSITSRILSDAMNPNSITSQTVQGFSTFVQHSGDLLQAADNAVQLGAPALNHLKNLLSEAVGNPTPRVLSELALIVGDETARGLGIMTQAEREQYVEVFNPDLSQRARKKIIEDVTAEMAQRFRSASAAVSPILGQGALNNTLVPAAQRAVSQFAPLPKTAPHGLNSEDDAMRFLNGNH